MIVSVIHRTAECMCKRCGARLGKCEHTAGEDAEARIDIRLASQDHRTDFWTEQEVATLLNLEAKGYTRRRIAELMSKTENAINGKLLRLSQEPKKPSILRRPYKVAVNG